MLPLHFVGGFQRTNPFASLISLVVLLREYFAKIEFGMSRLYLAIGCFIVLCFEHGNAHDCLLPLGMEDGRIKDNQLRALSSLSNLAGPIHARLNHTGGFGGWCPDQMPYKNETVPIYREFIQVELDTPLRIKGIRTQGRAGGVEKVGRYWLSYRAADKIMYNWYYVDNRHVVKFFEGNIRSKLHTSVLRPPVVADVVRLNPEIYPVTQVCLRFELLGCPIKSGLVTYEMPQGNSLGGRYNFTDSSYDGFTKGRLLSLGLGMLTDGRLAHENYIDSAGLGWIGWNAKETPAPYIIFEFLSTRIFYSATIHCNVRDKTGIKLFSKVEVSFSKDGYAFNKSQAYKFKGVSSESTWMNYNVTFDLCRRVGKLMKLNFTYTGHWILISEVIFNSEPLGSKPAPKPLCAPNVTNPLFTTPPSSSNPEPSSSNRGVVTSTSPSTETKRTEVPLVSGHDMVIIVSSTAALVCIVLVMFAIAWLLRRKKRQVKGARYDAVEGKQPGCQEISEMNPVNVAANPGLSASNDQEGKNIALCPPTVMVPGDSDQSPEYTNMYTTIEEANEASANSSHAYTSLVKFKDGKNEYVNQITTPEYMNTYFALKKTDDREMSANDSLAYASLVKSKEGDGDYEFPIPM